MKGRGKLTLQFSFVYANCKWTPPAFISILKTGKDGNVLKDTSHLGLSLYVISDYDLTVAMHGRHHSSCSCERNFMITSHK